MVIKLVVQVQSLREERNDCVVRALQMPVT
jgi:hypothetical protein